jgi:beta-lactamase regulating signal transducer with metallopeptidase domain
METLLQISLTNAVAATLLALIVGCIGLVCRRPALMHGLWLLVLLKLVTPPLLLIPIDWPTPPGAVSNPPAATAEPTPTPEPLAEFALDADTFPYGPDAVPPVVEAVGPSEEPADFLRFTTAQAEDSAQPGKPPLPAPASAWWAEWWQTVILAVWLSGSALWYVCAARRLLRFQHLLRHARLAPVQLQKRTERLARKLGMTGAPTVYLVPGRLSPLLWAAFGAPRLVLPAGLLEQIDGEQRDTLILHELAHLRRRDHWVRALEFVVMGLYWWHPVIWFVRRELREAEEQCCDAWVVSSLPQANRTYATALVETIDFLSAVRSPVPLLASGVGPISDLKRRLTMIMRGTTPRTLSWRGVLMVLALGAFLLPLLPLLPGTAQAQEKKPELDPRLIDLHPQIVDLDFAFEDSPEGQAELAKLKAQLEQKMKEIQDTQAKIKAIHEKLHMAEGAKTEALNTYRFHLKGEKGADSLEVILRKVGDKWEVVDPKAIANAFPWFGDAKFGKPQEAPYKPAIAEFKDGKLWVQPVPHTMAQPGHSDTDRRIDQLEKKLEKIMQQIEQMQKELKGARSGVNIDREMLQKIEKDVNIDRLKPPMIDRGFFPNQDGPLTPPVIDPKAFPKKVAPPTPPVVDPKGFPLRDGGLTPPPVLDPGFGPEETGRGGLRPPGIPRAAPVPPATPPPAL